MSIWQSARLIVTTRLHVPKFKLTRKRLLLIILLVVVVGGLAYFYFSSPLTRMNAARAQWDSTGIHDYRIVAKYEIPFFDCQQDLEVRDEEITYRYEDGCGGGNAPFDALIVSNLFKRIEANATNPACGANGCACDGPIGIDVIYDPERGYPQQLIYRTMPELRWHYLEYWQAQFSGNPVCPLSAKNALPPSSETITVLSLKPLKPAKTELGIGTLPLSTAEAP